MAARRNESYERLQDLVNAWTAEVSEVRTQLDSSVRLRLSGANPAFSLREDLPRNATATAVADLPLADTREPADLEAETETNDTAHLRSELDFARDMLETLNADLQETRARHHDAQQAADAAHAKAKTLEEQLRHREWGLRKAENERELLREDLDRLRSENGSGINIQSIDVDDSSRAALDALTAQLHDTSAKLREAGHEITRLKKDLAERDEKYDDAIRTADELRDIADTARTEVDATRESFELRMKQLREDYDALASSHMQAREAVAELQGKVVERDMRLEAIRNDGPDLPLHDELRAVRDELATYQTALQDAEVRIDEITDARDTLQTELDTLRSTAERSRFEQDFLVKALRDEIDALRSVATEREFVANHQEDAIGAVERELLAEQRKNRETAEALSEKDAMLRQMRSELTTLKDRQERHEQEVGVLTAKLESKDAALLRARDRINLLRDLVKKSPDEKVMPDPELAKVLEEDREQGSDFSDTGGSLSAEGRIEKTDVDAPTPTEEIDFTHWQPNAAVQREIEESVPIEFPWPVVVLAALLAGGGLITTAVILFLFI